MDKFSAFLESVHDADPAIESVSHMYTQLRHGQLYKPLVVPDSVRSVTVDPRSGLGNKIVTSTIDGTGAPTTPFTSSSPSACTRDPHEETTKDWQEPPKPQKIKTTPNKQIKSLMDKAKDHLPNPVQFTKTYTEQVPTCGYTVKAGSGGTGCSYINGVDAGYSAGGSSASSGTGE